MVHLHKSVDSVAGGTVWLTAANIISSGGILAFFIAATRILSVTDLGIVSYLAMISSLFMSFMCFALPQAITKFVADLKSKNLHNEASGVFHRIFKFGEVLSFSSIIILLLSYHLLFSVNESSINKSLSITLLFALDVGFVILIQFVHGSLRGLRIFSSSAVITIVSSVIKYGGSVVLLLLNGGILGIVFSWFLGDSMGLVYGLVILRNEYKESIHTTTSSNRIIQFSAPIYGSDILLYFNSTIDRFLIVILSGVTLLGQYSPAVTAAGFISSLPNAMTTALFTKFAEIGEEEENIHALEKIASRWISIIFLPISFGIAILSPSIIYIFAGPSYLVGAPALFILSMTMGMTSLSAIVNSRLLGQGRTNSILLGKSVAIPSTLLVGILLIGPLGVVGAAITRAAAIAVVFVSTLILLRRGSSTNYDRRAIIDALVSSIIMILVIHFTQIVLPSIVFVPIHVAIGLFVYLCTLRIRKTLKPSDFAIANKIFPKQLRSMLRLLRRILVSNDSQ